MASRKLTEAKAQSHAQPEQPFPVEYEPGDARLPAVHNKLHNQWFPPPTEHLGVPLADASPVNVALLALGYYRNVLASAQDKFGQARGNGSPPVRRL